MRHKIRYKAIKIRQFPLCAHATNSFVAFLLGFCIRFCFCRIYFSARWRTTCHQKDIKIRLKGKTQCLDLWLWGVRVAAHTSYVDRNWCADCGRTKGWFDAMLMIHKIGRLTSAVINTITLALNGSSSVRRWGFRRMRQKSIKAADCFFGCVCRGQMANNTPYVFAQCTKRQRKTEI